MGHYPYGLKQIAHADLILLEQEMLKLSTRPRSLQLQNRQQLSLENKSLVGCQGYKLQEQECMAREEREVWWGPLRTLTSSQRLLVAPHWSPAPLAFHFFLRCFYRGIPLQALFQDISPFPRTFKAALNPRRNKAGLCFLKNHGVQEGALLRSLAAELCPTAAPLPAPSRELTSRNVAQFFAFKGGKPPMSQQDIHKTHSTHSAHALREGNCWSVSAHMHVAGFYAI